MARPKITLKFLLPGFDEFVSGGNIYNKNLIEALKDLPENPFSILVNSSPFSNTFSSEEIIIVDSIYLSDKQLFNELEDRKFILLIHHFPSLELLGEEREIRFAQNEKRIFQRAKHLIVTGKYCRDFLIERGFANEFITLLEPAFEQKSTGIKRAADDLHALIVGNLIPRKGILHFLKNLDELWPAELALPKIILAGSDKIDVAHATIVKEILSEHKRISKSVEYVGQLDQYNLFEYYKQVNLLISVSRMETFGMALQEARFFKLPILAIDAGNVKSHIVEGKTGHLFNDVESLIKKMIYFKREILAFKQIVRSSDHSNSDGFVAYKWKHVATQFVNLMIHTAYDRREQP